MNAEELYRLAMKHIYGDGVEEDNALEILALGKVPFYCAAWCNLKSVRNAIKCGFRPAWVEVTARDAALVEALNRR